MSTESKMDVCSVKIKQSGGWGGGVGVCRGYFLLIDHSLNNYMACSYAHLLDQKKIVA